LKQVIEEDRHENYIPLNRSNRHKINSVDLFLYSNKVAYKLGCSLSTVRREWRKIDPSVRRGQWQVDEDEVQIKIMQNNMFFLLVFRY